MEISNSKDKPMNSPKGKSGWPGYLLSLLFALFILLGFIGSACKKSDPEPTPDPDPTPNPGVTEVQLPGGTFDMGDHFGFVDPAHPSDELPIHSVKVNTFRISTTETSNQQFLAYLNSALTKGLIEVKGNIVYAVGTTDIYCYTHQYAAYYSIGYDGKTFSITDFRANHPVVGIMWSGAAAYCNWISSQNILNECYNLKTWVCDFTKNGYRLPTEAEWEYAARGGKTSPYYNYPWGDTQDITKANWPDSKDPYEGTSESAYPFTTPCGFYDGKLHQKSEYNWPGSATTYQTSNGANGFGLYDMAGNVWEFVNDWYGQNYYSTSPTDNPKGPDTGFLMPDGKAYRGMRGGNWYNGYTTAGSPVNDGHSRVSNRNPSYYRGPQDPNHPYYHLGFRVARN
ncbi:MAG: SUMF1/EgtB/PvdO family nonheme iron enzyme [Mariniphaga sp.]